MSRRLAIFATILLACATSAAQDDGASTGKDERESSQNALGPLQQITRQLKKFGPWEDQLEMIEPAMDRLWEQNRWTDDGDRFALNTAKEVARIPPWRVMERLGRFTNLVGERYRLSDQQKTGLQGSIMRETAGLLVKHGPTLMEQVRKAVAKNDEFRDHPPSREDVAAFMAEWTRATEPLHRDALEATERIRADLERGMDPSQRELVRRDLPTLEKLTRFANDQRAEWARGQWDPSDWGLRDEDLGWASSGPSKTDLPGPPGKDAGGAEPATRWLSYEPKTWIAYVRHAIALYGLDEPQTAAATSIHAELLERATTFIDQRSDELTVVKGDARRIDAAWAPVRECFRELCERVEAIPTQAQRDGARSGK
ncbi:MAG: hypothetical protein C4547_09010 [Phycisphaerales bacterium]|nr:MAG: hypothetical protein C4547_09010 [Phycisphaerales bacterium]